MIDGKVLDEWSEGLVCLIPRVGACAPSCHEFSLRRCDCEMLELISLARLGLSVMKKSGPAGLDRRWKVACETVLRREFKTPREMMDLLAELMSTKGSTNV